MTDSAGNVQAVLAYDPYGRVNNIKANVVPDFQYAGYYFHAPSGLNLTRTRLYSSQLGRWFNRDPYGEDGGINLYSYVGNFPISGVDPSGMQRSGPITYEPITFHHKTGVPPEMLTDWGCIGVVDWKLGLPGGVAPEGAGALPAGSTNCWWGKLGDVGPALPKACAKKCPPGTHRIKWCKQGYIGQSSRGAPGTPVSDPGAGRDPQKQANGEWNYSVYDPVTRTFMGADTAGGAGG